MSAADEDTSLPADSANNSGGTGDEGGMSEERMKVGGTGAGAVCSSILFAVVLPYLFWQATYRRPNRLQGRHVSALRRQHNTAEHSSETVGASVGPKRLPFFSYCLHDSRWRGSSVVASIKRYFAQLSAGFCLASTEAMNQGCQGLAGVARPNY